MTDWFVLPDKNEEDEYYSFVWWVAMVTLAAVTTVLFFVAWFKTRKYPYEDVDSWSKRYSMGMRLLAIPYVFECVWRSFFPALYNWRQTFFDTNMNAPLVNRSLAFVGEVCYATQIAWAIYMLSQNMCLKRNAPAKLIRRYIPWACIYIALQSLVSNFFSLFGMVTTNNLYNTLEEVGWMLIFLIGGICAGIILFFSIDSGLFGDDDNDNIPNIFDKDTHPSVQVMRIFLRGMVFFSFVYVPYMIAFDIPKYWQRYQDELATNQVYMTVSDGFHDSLNTRIITVKWDDWAQEWVWMTFYFSFAAWSSIALMFAPGRLQDCEPCTDSSKGGPIIATTNSDLP